MPNHMKITILSACKGRLEQELQHLINDYLKQLRWEIKFIDIPTSNPNTEGTDFVSRSRKFDYTIALDPNGDLISSEAMAEQFKHLSISSKANLCIIIGGPSGLSQEVLRHCNLIWSLGRITLPHRLVKLIITEQIYRSWSIINSRNYHK